MKIKKYAILILVIFMLALCLGACDMGKITEQNPVKPSIPGKPVNPTPNPTQDGEYIVRVFYKNAPFDKKDADIFVVWQNDIERISLPLGNDGSANAGKLDGDYNVRLVGLPEKYAYDPNAYRATGNSCTVNIIVNDVVAPSSGDGSNIYTSYGCFAIKNLGFYKISCKQNTVYYYEFEAIASGRYVIESHCDIREDMINPMIDVYSGSSAFKLFSHTVDDGGDSLKGGYTKNFKWVIDIPASEVGAAYTFGVKAESKIDEYPVTVTFELIYKGPISDYNEVEQKTVHATETAELTPPSGGTYHSIELGTKLFTGKVVKYNEVTKLYHVYSLEAYPDGALPEYGAGFGPILCCSIVPPLACYSVTTLYEANQVGDSEVTYNLLVFTDRKPDGSGYIKYDYTNFIRVSYYGVCNSDGICPVTEELKQFLQDYAVYNELWKDGYSPGIGTPDDKKYTAKQDDLWLFACGFYENDSSVIPILTAKILSK